MVKQVTSVGKGSNRTNQFGTGLERDAKKEDKPVTR